MAGPGAKSAACRRCSACCGQDPLRIPTPGRCTASACENTGNRPLNIRTPFYGVFDQLGPIRGSDPTVGAARHPSSRAAQRDWWLPANGRTASLRLHRQAHAAPPQPASRSRFGTTGWTAEIDHAAVIVPPLVQIGLSHNPSVLLAKLVPAQSASGNPSSAPPPCPR